MQKKKEKKKLKGNSFGKIINLQKKKHLNQNEDSQHWSVIRLECKAFLHNHTNTLNNIKQFHYYISFDKIPGLHNRNKVRG